MSRPGTAPATPGGWLAGWLGGWLGGWRLALLSLLAALLLLWPLLVNADYLYFHDTAAYLRYPAQAFQKLLGIKPLLSAAPAPVPVPAPVPLPDAATLPGAVAGGAVAGADDTVAAGRSIYYGGMLYAGALVGGLWVGVLAQLAAVALALYLALTGLLGPAGRTAFPGVVALLALATPLPFFVTYLMPDVFAGVAILAVACLFALDESLGRGRRLAWAGLLGAALLFHSSHTVVAALMLVPATAVTRAATRRLPWRAAATVAAAILLALAGEVVFSRAVEAVYGAPPLRPPFLMARMISDGPGTAYLMARCPEIHLAICDWRDRLPLDTDNFLWSKDAATGVYGVADAATRRAFDAEQAAFVKGVLAHDPWGQLAASARGFAEQLSRVGLHEFAYDDTLRQTLPAMLPPPEARAFEASALYRGSFPLGPADWLVRAGLAASLLVPAWAMLRGSGARPGASERPGDAGAGRVLLAFAVILVGGVVANAAVTGILSTPHDRYQARVIWLIPLLAMIVFLHVRRRPLPAAAPATRLRAS